MGTQITLVRSSILYSCVHRRPLVSVVAFVVEQGQSSRRQVPRTRREGQLLVSASGLVLLQRVCLALTVARTSDIPALCGPRADVLQCWQRSADVPMCYASQA